MKLPCRVQNVVVHCGHVYPELYPCDCRGIACEDFLDEIVEYVLSGGMQVLK